MLSLRNSNCTECDKNSSSHSQCVRRSNRQMQILTKSSGFISSRKSTVLHLFRIYQFRSSNTAKMCWATSFDDVYAARKKIIS